MSLETWAVTLSCVGALLFFCSGLAFARYHATVRKERALPAAAEPVQARADTEAIASGDFLRAVLAREGKAEHLTGAVIADELGLVVAATGELSEVLAAYGAVLAGIGARTGEALPLDDVRHIVLKDDHDTTLTVRKIVTQDERFSLVTLTSGERSITPRVAAALGR